MNRHNRNNKYDQTKKKINDVYLYIRKNNFGRCLRKIPFSSITTLKIGGNIELLYYPKTKEALVNVLKLIRKNNIKHFIIGNGSNVLANDIYYDGIVINLREIESNFEIKETYVDVPAGMSMAKLIFSLMKYSLGGLEYLIGIPGTIGAMICMNAGAFNKSISENIIEISVIDKDSNLKKLRAKDLLFSYRNSNIKEEEMIVLDAKLSIVKKDKEKIKEEIKIYMQDRKEKQPLELCNAGCAFKNNIIPAWKLIDDVGLRDYRINDVGVSNKHSNFLVNYGKGNAFDMMNLINIIKSKIREAKNIEIECEWVFVNFDFHENEV